MDVVCDRCQTEYEFDDALVSERGTTVKCTNCGHQFKIYRPPSGTGHANAVWVLRRGDGSTVQFDSLAVLQKWIAEGRVTRADHLSRAGSEWKALGSIAELDSFFANAEGRAPSRPSGANPAAPVPRPGAATAVGSPAAPPRPAQTPAPAPARAPTPSAQPSATGAPAGPTTLRAGSGPQPTGATPAAAQGATGKQAVSPFSATMPIDAPPGGFSMGSTPAPSGSGSERFALGESSGIVEQWGTGTGNAPLRRPTPPPLNQLPSVAPPAFSSPSVMPRARHDDYGSGDGDDVELPMRGGALGRVVPVIAIVLVLGGAGGVAVWKLGLLNSHRSAPGLTAPADAVSIGIDRAEQSARVATRVGFEDARDTLNGLLSSNPDEPRLRAARAEVLALLGELRRQRAEDLDARAALNGPDAVTLRAESAVIRSDVSADLDRAREDFANADSGVSRIPPGAEHARYDRELGETARILGDMSSARRHLDAARAAGGGSDVDLLAAMLERDAGQADAAIAHFRALTVRPETAVRAHLALARLLSARGDPSAAVEVAAVLREHAGHEDAQSLAQAIASQTPPFRGAAAPAAAQPAGQPVAAPAPVVAVAPAQQATAPASQGEAAHAATPGEPGAVPHPAGRNYDALVEEGERFQEHGSRDRARAAFMAALDMRPDGSEAITGLGYLELDGGSSSVAISHFRRALSVNPRYSDAMIGLAEAFSRSGQLQDALRSYRDYLNDNPSGQHAAEARRHIEMLESRLAPAAGGGGDNGGTQGSGSGSTGGSGSATSGSGGGTTPTTNSAGSGSNNAGGGSSAGGTGGSGSGSGSGGSGGGSTGSSPSGGDNGSATNPPAASPGN